MGGSVFVGLQGAGSSFFPGKEGRLIPPRVGKPTPSNRIRGELLHGLRQRFDLSGFDEHRRIPGDFGQRPAVRRDDGATGGHRLQNR